MQVYWKEENRLGGGR